MLYWNTVRSYKTENFLFKGDDMEVGYEEEIDDLAIILFDDYEYDHSTEIKPGFIVDIDKNNKLCAIEVLDCSKRINKPKKYIKNAKIEAFVEVYEFSYVIIISFNDGEEEITQRVLK